MRRVKISLGGILVKFLETYRDVLGFALVLRRTFEGV